jgi:hypothetical protein
MITNPLKRLTYTNIKVYGGEEISHIRLLTPDMIIKRKVERTIHKKDGTNSDVEKFEVNVDFWKSIKEPVNVVLDEAHTILDSRRSFSKKSVCVNRWLALIRRVLGDVDGGNSEVVFITQRKRKVDINLRESANQIRWHTCYYLKICKDCGFAWEENSDAPEIIYHCPKCGKHNLIKKNHKVHVLFFTDLHSFTLFDEYRERTYFKEIMINNISDTFHNYNTVEWDGLFNDY